MKRLFLIFCLVPWVCYGDASLTFGGAASNKVDLGTGSATFTAVTVCAWIRPTTLGAFNMIWTKATGVSDEVPSFALGPGATNDELRVKWARATPTVYVTNNVNLALNNWRFVAFTIDQAATPVVHIYFGSQTAPVVEATYGTATDGSGAFTSNAGQTIQIGNLNGDTLSWAGQIANVQAWTRVLTLNEIENQRLAPRETGSMLHSHYLGLKGTSTQPDFSGNGNNGSVTGAVVSTLGPPISIGGSPL